MHKSRRRQAARCTLPLRVGSHWTKPGVTNRGGAHLATSHELRATSNRARFRSRFVAHAYQLARSSKLAARSS